MRILDKNRIKYKKKFSAKIKCEFCHENKKQDCRGLAGIYWRVLVNIYPYMDGNVMIVPKRHLERVEDINEDEWKDFGDTLKRTQKVLGKIFKTKSFNVGLNVGIESGASIPHLHWQVIPRKFKNITVANTFADLYVVAVPPETTKKLIDKVLTNKFNHKKDMHKSKNYAIN